jgi:hypothetical protein
VDLVRRRPARPIAYAEDFATARETLTRRDAPSNLTHNTLLFSCLAATRMMNLL